MKISECAFYFVCLFVLFFTSKFHYSHNVAKKKVRLAPIHNAFELIHSLFRWLFGRSNRWQASQALHTHTHRDRHTAARAGGPFSTVQKKCSCVKTYKRNTRNALKWFGAFSDSKIARHSEWVHGEKRFPILNILSIHLPHQFSSHLVNLLTMFPIGFLFLSVSTFHMSCRLSTISFRHSKFRVVLSLFPFNVEFSSVYRLFAFYATARLLLSPRVF